MVPGPAAPKSDEFSMEVVRGPDPEDISPWSVCATGRIRVGDFSEKFPMDLGFWSVDRYLRSWEAALARMENDEEVTSCLISSITDPTNSDFITCRPLYREGEAVYVQNALIFLDQIEGVFDPEAPWSHVWPRATVDEEGRTVSEWTTRIDQVRLFRSSQGASFDLEKSPLLARTTRHLR